MIRPFDLPDKFRRLWNLDYVPDSRHEDAGWHAANSVNARDCIPCYRLRGGGVTTLTDLPESLDRCISNIKQRRAECDNLIEQLTKFRESFPAHDEQES